MPAEEPQAVAVEERVDVVVAIAPGGQNAGQLLQVGDRVQAAGRLFGAEAAVQVTADAHVPTVAGFRVRASVAGWQGRSTGRCPASEFLAVDTPPGSPVCRAS